MSDGSAVAFEFAHGQLSYIGYQYGPKVSQPLPSPSEETLLAALEGRRGMSQLTLVRLDCPLEHLTDEERAWHDLSAVALTERLGVPVRQVSDIHALVKGLAAREDPRSDFAHPYGVIILNDSDSDPGTGGVVRKYLVHDPTHWQSLPFGEDGPTLDFVSNGVTLLSRDMPATREAVRMFIAQHPDVERLVVWSPDDMPIRSGSSNELRPDHSVACRVTYLNDNTFVLASAAQHG